MRNRPEVLILASRFDLTTDILVSHLRSRGLVYLRLNSQDLPNLEVSLEPLKARLEVFLDNESWVLDPSSVRAVFYRRPTYFSETLPPPQDPEECLGRAHWLTFMRSLVMFDSALWVNSPSATYTAENKPLQLKVAHELGFQVPTTLVTNTTRELPSLKSEKVVLKGVDTVRVTVGDEEHFGYSQVCEPTEVSSLARIPAIVQEYIADKVDVRVTVVGDKCFAAEILKDGRAIETDWRLEGRNATPSEIQLPTDIADLCIRLVRRLGLVFGAIDLVYNESGYHFLEINPTGEWGWLDTLGLPIGESIAEVLCA